MKPLAQKTSIVLKTILLSCVILIGLFSIIGTGGGGGGSGGGDDGEAPADQLSIKLGAWNADGTSFDVVSGSYWIENLEVSVSGTILGNNCSYTYTSSVKISERLEVIENEFNWESPGFSQSGGDIGLPGGGTEFRVHGVFIDETSANVEVWWTHSSSASSSECDGWETGNKVITAHHSSVEETSLPTAGEWSGTAGFGEIDFVVSQGGTGIAEITINFDDFICGGGIYNGSFTFAQNPAVSIENNQFTVSLNPSINENVIIDGAFDSETSASGTYEANFYDSQCTGHWNASYPGTGGGGGETSDPFNINGMLQYRTHSDDDNKYKGWLEITKNGNPVDKDNIIKIELKDGDGNPVSISTTSFWENSLFWGKWDSSTSSINFSLKDQVGFIISFPDNTNLSSGNYTYEATTNELDLLSVTKYFPGETTMPTVDVASMNYEWLSNGDLHLEWLIPNGTFDEFKVVLLAQTGIDFLDAILPPEKSELRIPNDIVQQITDNWNPNFAYWSIQTRSYTDTSDRNQYARGISEILEIPWDDVSMAKIKTWYKDADADGYSDGSEMQSQNQPNGYYLSSELTSITGDCNDSDASINQGMNDIPDDGIDQNCDGTYNVSIETKIEEGPVEGIWDLIGAPYIIEGPIEVKVGKILEIKPGVVLKFSSGSSLKVNGTFSAVGSEANRIIFTSAQETPSPGDWNGLKIYKSSNSNCNLQECVIEYAKEGINIHSASPNISNCTLRNNSSNGIGVYATASGCSGGYAAPSISRCIIEFNSGYGIKYAGSGSLFSGCTIPKTGIVAGVLMDNKIHHNGLSGIRVRASSGFLSGGAASPQIIQNKIHSNFKHGIIIEGSRRTSPDIENNEISENMDSGIYITNTGGTISISNNIIKQNGGLGIYNVDSDTDISGNVITQNLSHGIQTCNIDNFTDNEIHSNSEYDFYYTTEIFDQIAVDNNWGTTKPSEIDEKIFDFLDNKDLGKVFFQHQIPSHVIEITPSNQAKNVLLDSSIEVTFDVEIDPASLSSDTLRVRDGSKYIVGNFQAIEKTAIFTPEMELEPNINYEIIITTGIRSKSGINIYHDYKTSFTTGAFLSGFESPDSFPGGIAFDRTYLWLASNGTNKIYKMETSGKVIDSFDSPDRSPFGLAFDGTYLWLAGRDTRKIYKIETSGKVIATFDSPSEYPNGLTFDGSYLWLSGERGKIFKMRLF